MTGPTGLTIPLTVALAVIISALNLTRRHMGHLRLFGSSRSAWLTLAVIASTAGLSLIASFLPLLTGSRLAVGAFVAVGLSTPARGRQQTDGIRPLVKILTCGVAQLTEVLEQRMQVERFQWCEQFLLGGFKDLSQMQAFVIALADHLDGRHGEDKALHKAVGERKKEALTAIETAGETEAGVAAACRAESSADGKPRPRHLQEERSVTEVRTAAVAACRQLLFLAYGHASRDGCREIMRIRQAAAPLEAFHHLVLPRQKRRLFFRPKSKAGRSGE